MTSIQNPEWNVGFLTENGYFLTRKQAAVYAIARKQITCTKLPVLTSEDLWDDDGKLLTAPEREIVYAILKYKIEIPAFSNKATVLLPHGAKILRGGVEKGEFYLWALVDIELQATVATEVVVLGTGYRDLEWPGEYLNSERVPEGDKVFHYFIPRKT